MIVIYAVFAALPLLCYEREEAHYGSFSEFYSKAFGKQQKKKLCKLIPVGIIVLFAGIYSRIYVITVALLALNGLTPCFFCATGISHSVCNNAVIKIGSGRVVLPVVMFTIVGVLSVASYVIWLRVEYKKSKKEPAGL